MIGGALHAPYSRSISDGDQAYFAAENRRAEAIASLEKANPKLGVWLTLPVETNGLQDNALSVIESMLRDHVTLAGVNVMTMDFGAPIASGQYGTIVTSAVSACQNQLQTLGMNAALGITMLIGTNDESDETFLLSDAQTVASFARAQPNIKRLAFWEVSRDNGSCGSAPADLDDDNCSSVSQGNWAFSQIFESN